MRNDYVNNTLSLLGGASLGAIAMYLLDPDQGHDRRDLLVESAGRVVTGATAAVHGKAHGAVDSARDFASSVSQYAHDLADRVGDHVSRHASDLSGQGQAVAEGASGHVRSAVQSAIDSAKDYANRAVDRARATHDDVVDRATSIYSLGKTTAQRKSELAPSHPYAVATGITAGTVGVLAIGAGLMYFLDPERGRGRRARVRDQAVSATRRAGKSARRYGRHLGNQFQGYAHDAKASVPENWSNAVDRATLAVASVNDGLHDSQVDSK